MCIIVLDSRNSNETLSREILRRCQDTNSDGMGIMYAYEGELHTWHTMKRFKGIYERYEYARSLGVPVAVHFRIGTKGNISLDNCHPFAITDDFAVMHNGTVGWMTRYLPDGISDSKLMADSLFGDLPPDFLRKPLLRRMVEESIYSDRMLFMDAEANTSILNSHIGFWHEGDAKEGGVWFSHNKTRTFITKGVKPYNYNREGNGRGWRRVQRDGVWVDEKFDVEEYARKNHNRDMCVCQNCRKYRHTRDAFEKRLKEREKEVRPVVGYARKGGVVERVPEQITLLARYEMNSFPKVTTALKSPTLFTYGRFRDDLEGPTWLKHLPMIGPGIMKHSQLWAVKDLIGKGNDGDTEIPAAVISGEKRQRMIHGHIYELPHAVGAMHKALRELDEELGCAYGSPRVSLYHRFLRPVVMMGNAEREVIYSWAYMIHPCTNFIRWGAPVTFGDWKRWVDNQTLVDADTPPVEEEEEGKGSIVPTAPATIITPARNLDQGPANLLDEIACQKCDSEETTIHWNQGTPYQWCYTCASESQIDLFSLRSVH